jgi:sterol desaturase/sphingolipid hydroxylase (fatty acid hydroxylase superfamily)
MVYNRETNGKFKDLLHHITSVNKEMLDIFTPLETLILNGETYLLLVPIYTILLVGERVIDALWTRHVWDLRDTALNLVITLLTLGINIGIGHLLPLSIMAYTYAHCASWTLSESIGGWVLAFLLYDLAWYIDHRIGHRVSLFWAMHQVHHSSTEYNTTVASRGFLFDITLINRPMFYLLPVLGVSPFQFICISIVTNIWGIAQHTRLVGNVPILDLLFATPSNHRVHHGKEPKYIDRNYGEVLIIWDRIFGTYQSEEEEPSYGVIEPINTYNLVNVQLIGFKRLIYKFKNTSSWTNKLKVLVFPPDWRAKSIK